jgi:hypothetical protein
LSLQVIPGMINNCEKNINLLSAIVKPLRGKSLYSSIVGVPACLPACH